MANKVSGKNVGSGRKPTQWEPPEDFDVDVDVDVDDSDDSVWDLDAPGAIVNDGLGKGRVLVSDLVAHEIIDMYMAGVVVADIIRETKKAGAVVYAVLRKFGIPLRKVRGAGDGAQGILNAMTRSDIDDMLDRYYNGDRVRDICEAYGLLHIGQFYQILTLLGAEPKTQTEEALIARAAAIEEACRQYTAGVPLWKILRETGVPQSTLHTELHNRQIELRLPPNSPWLAETRAAREEAEAERKRRKGLRVERPAGWDEGDPPADIENDGEPGMGTGVSLDGESVDVEWLD